jgi:hypothetical protein
MMLTTLPQAHVADRARLGVAVRSASWRPVPVAPAILDCRTSDFASHAIGGYAGNATLPAANSVFMAMTSTTKRPTRHLATRTT